MVCRSVNEWITFYSKSPIYFRLWFHWLWWLCLYGQRWPWWWWWWRRVQSRYNGVPAANWHDPRTWFSHVHLKLALRFDFLTGRRALCLRNQRCGESMQMAESRFLAKGSFQKGHWWLKCNYCNISLFNLNGQVLLQGVIVRSFFDCNLSSFLWFERPPTSSRWWIIGWSIRPSWVLASHMASLKAELQWF